MLLNVAGGVALILFGVRFLKKGLDRLFGPKLGYWVQHVANRPIKAFLTGIGVSVVAPSSTTISVLAVSTVRAGHLTPRQMLALMFGADIGLTAMVLLISMSVDQYAPILILIGVGLFQFSKHDMPRGVGQVVLSLAFIFIGIGIIKGVALSIDTGGDLMKLVHLAESYPVMLALLAMVMAIALQSSTATISLVIALGAAERISLESAIAAVAGANVGIAVTTLLVGWSRFDSRRLSLGNLIAKCTVAIIVLSLLGVVARYLSFIPGGLHHRVAYAHTGFNVLLALLGLPLIAPLSSLIDRLVPAPESKDEPEFGPRYLMAEDIDSAALALGMSMREIMHVGEIVRSMLDDLWQAVRDNDITLARSVSSRDDQVDRLDADIKHFLTNLSALEGDERGTVEQIRQLRYLNELETIGDIIDKNLSELAVKKAKLKASFSDEGWEELDDFFMKVRENLLIADTAFTSRDRHLAQQLLNHKEFLRDYDRNLRDRHFARLNSGLRESHETSAIHLDLLTHLKRINSHVTHVAYAILDDPGPDESTA